jgi:hypothetical protein
MAATRVTERWMLYNGNVTSCTPKDASGNNTGTVVTVRSGQSADGWDWSQPPGTTTIAPPHDQLGMKEREDVCSQINFAGATAFRGDPRGDPSQSGLYAAALTKAGSGRLISPAEPCHSVSPIPTTSPPLT